VREEEGLDHVCVVGLAGDVVTSAETKNEVSDEGREGSKEENDDLPVVPYDGRVDVPRRRVEGMFCSPTS
jgi:hypothetical protein